MLTQRRIALICNASIEYNQKIQEKISRFPFLVAVDGGVNHCVQLNLKPNLLVGDLDSADPESIKRFSHVEQRLYPKEKDKTDLEIALELVFHDQVEEISIFGALGDRTDHTLGNLILLSRYPGKTFLETEKERLFVIHREVEFSTYPGQVISLIPLNGPAKGIHTTHLKWELKNGFLDKQFIGLSNVALKNTVKISVQEGDLLCCIND